MHDIVTHYAKILDKVSNTLTTSSTKSENTFFLIFMGLINKQVVENLQVVVVHPSLCLISILKKKKRKRKKKKKKKKKKQEEKEEEEEEKKKVFTTYPV